MTACVLSGPSWWIDHLLTAGFTLLGYWVAVNVKREADRERERDERRRRMLERRR